ncbi:hypothetical protein MKW92_014186 [Papaver armeniacum]|nr:hypothetical protein MKW92_014186 [Papaver armeniacum]
METLMMSSSSSSLLRSSKNRAFSSARSALLSTKNKPEFVSFRQKPNYNNVNISHSIIGSVSCKSSSSESSFSPQLEAYIIFYLFIILFLDLSFKTDFFFLQGNAGNTEIPSQDTLPKPAQVIFQLKKECSLSQELLLVGDDPAFGAWDPASAVPLKLLQGHIWTTDELDVPIKTIQYKFILKDRITGEIIWQPGPNRVLETWETINEIILVAGNWDVVYWERVADSNMKEEQVGVGDEKDRQSTNSAQPFTKILKDLDFDPRQFGRTWE